jgi:hypothetical protein
VNKRVGLGLAAILLLAVGFGAGWLTRGQASGQSTAPGQPGEVSRVGWQPTKEDDPVFWRYPKGDPAGSSQGGPQYIARFTTPDDIATVAAWYGERLGSGAIPVGQAGTGSGGGPDLYFAACDDSFRPGSVPAAPRGVKVGVGARSSPASAVTVALSRADGEDRTHIVVSFARR